ncbi:MAG: hypothetical protein ACI3X6_05095 [Alloprevotella sp.]
MPTFTCPSTPGTYRMRFKVDWNSIDPAGDSNSTNGDFKTNGGAIVDVMLEVINSVSYDVTFVYTLDGTELTRTTNSFPENAAFPDYNEYASIPSYVDVTAPSLPTTVTESGTYTIATTTKEDSPFKFSSSLANAQWLTMKLLFKNDQAQTYENGRWITGNSSNQTYLIDNTAGVNASNYGYYLWAFVGDWYNGYKIYPMGNTDKVLGVSSNTWSNGATNQSTRHVTLDDPSEDAGLCTWKLVDWAGTPATGETTEGSFSLLLKNSTHTNVYLGDHTADNWLSTWLSDAGNTANHGRIQFADPAPIYQPIAQSILDNQGVGYPAADSDVRNALSSAISGASFNELKSKVDAFMNESEQIELPTDGKAYRIKTKYSNSDVRWLKFTENAEATDEDLRLTLGLTSTEPTGYEGTFICHKVNDNEYLFTTNKGKFLTWCADGKNNVTGKLGSFASQFTNNGHNASLKLANTAIKSQSYAGDLFGALTLQGWNSSDNADFYLMAGTDNFHNAGATDLLYNETRSSAFYFEETEYPNLVNMTTATGIDEGTNKIATFSAPFAFILPENVDAYVVDQTPSGTSAKMTQLATAGSTVAANTGVILYGATSEAQVRMIPATETGATPATTLLGNSAGGTKQIVDVAGETNYILASKGGNIVFSKALANGENKNISMNKAYLSIPAGSGVNQFALSFGEDGPTTGIGSIEAGQAGSTAAPVYDLSGRRISQPATRGIYIRGGKKFMVK